MLNTKKLYLIIKAVTILFPSFSIATQGRNLEPFFVSPHTLLLDNIILSLERTFSFKITIVFQNTFLCHSYCKWQCIFYIGQLILPEVVIHEELLIQTGFKYIYQAKQRQLRCSECPEAYEESGFFSYLLCCSGCICSL